MVLVAAVSPTPHPGCIPFQSLAAGQAPARLAREKAEDSLYFFF